MIRKTWKEGTPVILFDGKLLDDREIDRVADSLQDFCIQTISGGSLLASEVIEACSVLSDKIRSGDYDTVLQPLMAKGVFTERQMKEAVAFFERENLEYKYRTELGNLIEASGDLQPPGEAGIIRRRYMPLGILFHIAAGNMEGLPFYSVIEGLLAGNVNILKLPSADDGLSVMILQELIRVNPRIAPYIAVFDIPSANIELLKRIGDMADAIVVWGGDEAIRAVRTMADPATQIISWGHKLSFAYVTPDIRTEELRELAVHICETNQLLCSSCQGIFVDTEDMAVVEEIGRRFLALLEEESADDPSLSLGIRGKISISLYNEELEAISSGRKVLRGRRVSVICGTDHELELSYMFRNCWVKPLPGSEIVKALKPYRGYLQTAGLACSEEKRGFLEEQLVRAGVVRIVRGFRMSRSVPGEAHDGEYALRRYSRVVELHV